MKKILISNDDGIKAPGIKALAEALNALGEVYIVAPDREQSASSHSLTLTRPLRVKRYGDREFSVDGTPTDAVHLAINGLYKDIAFDLVVSGVNSGGNMGDDITYSGTVSAAMESTLLRIPSFAISLDGRNGNHWESAKKYAQKVAVYILENGLPSNVLLNVNVPNLPLNKIKSYRLTRQGKRIYGDKVIEKRDPRGEKYFWIGGQELGFEPMEGTDLQIVNDGSVSITPVRLDLTDYPLLEKLSGMKI